MLVDVFVARQPILQMDGEIYAYELLYRSSKDNKFTHIDANRATSEVLMNSFITIGLDRLSENKPCFINFTEDLLLEKVPEYFDPRMLVVEILEDVSHNRDLIRVCRDLKNKGFLIALDDVVSAKQTDVVELLNYVDMIKVDIRMASEEGRAEVIQAAKEQNITLLAEKVETKEEHDNCVREGFELFQGFYYSKPVVISGVDLPSFSSTYLQMIEELSVPYEDINVEKITEILEQDLALTYKLLRLINSSNQSSVPVQSIKQAVRLLGTETVKKWLYVLSVEDTTPALTPSSQNVIKSSLQRAKTCEQISIRMAVEGSADGYFLTGFMSLIDVITQKPTNEVIESLPLETEIRHSLGGTANSYRYILDIVIAMEKADFGFLEDLLQNKSITLNELFEIYGQAIAWTDQLYPFQD